MTQNTAISDGLHFGMIILVLAIVGTTVLLGAVARRAGHAATVSKGLGLGVLALWLVYNAYYLSPAVFRWDTSLPLHVCDLLGAIAAWALITRKGAPRALLYFCALGLATQAIITPTGNQDPTSLRFWLYWLLHAWILAASVYDVSIGAFRPQLRDLRTALLADLLYVAAIVPIDIVMGWNYGYLGNTKPSVPTAIDLLGPWPGRIVLMILVVAAIQSLMYAPWKVRAVLDRRRIQTS